jgi:hypothetical protein
MSGSTGICCPANSVNCNGTCANLQTDPNNCGQCAYGCGTNGLACVGGQCSCTSNTANGTICFRPGQTRGACWSGACLLPGFFSGCTTAADCVPGGCLGGYCLGTVDIAGQINCTETDGEYIACPTSQGCSSNAGHVFCTTGTPGTTTCDGPSDCGTGADCCGNNVCYTRTSGGGVGSGCPSLGPGNQLGVLCDPTNPTATCPSGKSCMPTFSGVIVTWGCG